ncbi:hypothetical protein P154DRAFT_416198, partial [Amniculicola lignicola CBS 123094]
FLADKSETAIIRHLLGHRIPGAPALLDSAIINCIDCESWEVSIAGRFLTEVGLVTFDSRDLQGLSSPGAYAENIFKQAYFYHCRLTKNAHMQNLRYCRGDPERNRFGCTRFVSEQELSQVLNSAFSWPIDVHKPKLGFCPVIFLGHAIHNDLRMLHESVDLSNEAMENVVATIDTQHLARAAGLDQQISLLNLVTCHEFAFRDAHTACNDAAYTLFCGIMTALARELAPLNNGSPNTAQDVVDTMEAYSKVNSRPTFGRRDYCTKCNSLAHQRRYCRVRVECSKC